MIYKLIVRPILFFLPPEISHHIALLLVKLFHKIPLMSSLFQYLYCIKDLRLQRSFFGLTFKNPVFTAQKVEESFRKITSDPTYTANMKRL